MPDHAGGEGRPLETSYDLVAYPGRVFAATHPDRLSSVAVLHGLKPAPVSSCTVLELGAGDGTNLIGMAYELPDARFTGIDLAERPLARGRERAHALRLGNVDLRTMDVRHVPADFGSYDYIIAHGLWSWVPPDVRRETFAVIARHLAPQGVAFVSYLAYPGGHLRMLLRDMLRFHARDARTPTEKVARARELAALLTSAPTHASSRRTFPRIMAQDLADLEDGVLFHDWLAEVNEPATVTDFASQARAHGLSFLSEADFFATRFEHDPDLATAREELARLEAEDVLLKEQYLDFLTCRGFRQTLLCRDAAARDATPRASRIADLAIASAMQPVSEPQDLASRERVRFRTPKGRTLETDHPVVKAALARLGRIWPAWSPFEALLAEARALARRTSQPEEEDREVLAETLFQALGAGYVEAHTAPVPFTTQPGECPRASALARLAASEGPLVPNLRHEYVRVEDALGRVLIGLLDGERDRAALVRELEAAIASGEAELLRAGRAMTSPSALRDRLQEDLESSLRGLARLALLIQ